MRRITRGLAALSLCLVQCGIAQAQVVLPGDTVTPYFNDVRGWRVDVVSEQPGRGFVGCRASRLIDADAVAIDRIEGDWRFIFPTGVSAVYEGGTMDYDKYSIDAQFDLREGWAVRFLEGQELALLKGAGLVGVSVNNDPRGARGYSMAGSTAATLKVEECVRRGGQTASAAPSTPPAPPAPPPGANASAMPLIFYQVPVGESQVGDCDMGFTEPYRCTFDGQPPQPGYSHSLLVQDAFGEAPSMTINVIDTAHAHVWASLDGGSWMYMGNWHPTDGGTCAEPDATQTPDAEANIGQDYWKICILQ
jgi:hypothetical protein